MPSTLPDPQVQFAERLQSVDTGIAVFTQAGTGRQTGAILDEGAASGFRQIALADETGLGWARPVYLATTIGSLAVVRIAGGLLLALAPLFAGLLLFDLTRGLFAGWLRGLALVALGSLGLTVLLSVELAILEPWLADVLNRRGLGYATPTAPTELLALVAAFAIAAAGLTFILGKIAFQNAWSHARPVIARVTERAPAWEQGRLSPRAANEIPVHSRALAISESVASSIRREEVRTGTFDPVRRIGMDRPSEGSQGFSGTAGTATEPLGSGYRRNHRRDMLSQRRRDDRG
jgi:type IV secretion system protein VirB6